MDIRRWILLNCNQLVKYGGWVRHILPSYLAILQLIMILEGLCWVILHVASNLKHIMLVVLFLELYLLRTSWILCFLMKLIRLKRGFRLAKNMLPLVYIKIILTISIAFAF